MIVNQYRSIDLQDCKSLSVGGVARFFFTGFSKVRNLYVSVFV